MDFVGSPFAKNRPGAQRRGPASNPLTGGAAGKAAKVSAALVASGMGRLPTRASLRPYTNPFARMMRSMQTSALGFTVATPAAAGESILTGEPQANVMLGTPLLSFTGLNGILSLVTDIAVSGQPAANGSVGAPIGLFAAGGNYWQQGSSGLAVPILHNRTVAFRIAGDAAGSIAATIATEPASDHDAELPDLPSIAGDVAYYVGLGNVSVGAGASASLTSTIRSACELHELVTLAASGGLLVTSVKLNNVELLAGAVGSFIPESAFSGSNPDRSYAPLDVPAGANMTLTVTFFNSTAGAIVVGGLVSLADRRTRLAA